MLNIPEEIKTLFKRDDIFKNFHVHFPNGENADLNNDDIVSESVEFTESLCSQQAFRFGLTEASEIKFTCVNVPNIRGAVIECAIEIQADSLGAEWIEDNAPTGNEEFLDPQVCVYGSRNMYRVPYGRFIVDTCPRNHETMYKRDVTAYTERVNSENANPIQTGIMNAFVPTETYTVTVKPYALSIIEKNSVQNLLSYGYEKTAVTSGGPAYEQKRITLYFSETRAAIVTLKFYYNYYSCASGVPATVDQSALFGINTLSEEETDALSELAEVLEELGFDPVQSGYATYEEMAAACLEGYTKNPRLFVPNNTFVIPESNYVAIPESVETFYPFFNENQHRDIRLENFTKIELSYTSSTGTITREINLTKRVSMDKYVDTDTSSISTLSISFPSTLETERTDSSGNTAKFYSFANAFSLSDIVQGYLELLCRFGSPARTGGMEITALDNTSPVSILPENYAELWYDETTIAPIGYVQVKFKDETDNEQDLTVQIGTGASVYDLRDNAVLQNMVFTVSKAEAEAGITIESKLLAFLNSVFTPNIPDLTFIPIELTKKGLPYLEAGDAVTITTGDGQVVPSFILRQTVKGIQFLTADVESANGEAVEMVEI